MRKGSLFIIISGHVSAYVKQFIFVWRLDLSFCINATNLENIPRDCAQPLLMLASVSPQVFTHVVLYYLISKYLISCRSSPIKYYLFLKYKTCDSQTATSYRARAFLYTWVFKNKFAWERVLCWLTLRLTSECQVTWNYINKPCCPKYRVRQKALWFLKWNNVLKQSGKSY